MVNEKHLIYVEKCFVMSTYLESFIDKVFCMLLKGKNICLQCTMYNRWRGYFEPKHAFPIITHTLTTVELEGLGGLGGDVGWSFS